MRMKFKWLAPLALLPAFALVAPQPVLADDLGKAISAQFTKLKVKTKAHAKVQATPRSRLTAEEHQKLEDWLARAEGKGLVPIDHSDPGDLEGLDLLRRLGGYPTRSDYLKKWAKIRSKAGHKAKVVQAASDPVCKDFLTKYQSNGLFLDLGQKDGKLMATVLQANAHDGLPAVKFASLVQVIDSDKNPVTGGDGLGGTDPILVTYAPPKPGVYLQDKPPRAAVEFTVFQPDGTPCSYRDVKAMMPWPQSITVKAPNNTRSNSKTVLCLNRGNPDPQWPQACDFGPFSQAKHDTGWAVVVPQQGEVVLPGPVSTKPDGSVDADLRVTAINSKNGVTCQGQDVDVGKTVLAAAKVDPQNANKLTWSLLADKAPTFGQTCYEAHTGLNFNMFWNIRVQSGGVPQTVTAIVSNTLSQGSYNTLIVPAVDLQFGCLPTGTQVTMANGETKAIEKITKGELVRGADGKPWEVWNRMVGEDLSLVKIVGANGAVIKTSETHPVVVGHEADGRPRAIPAFKVKPGMPLVTATGTTTVASAASVPYDGPVYNLAIRPQGAKETSPKGGAFYADGVLVGDQTMQGLAAPASAQVGGSGKNDG